MKKIGKSPPLSRRDFLAKSASLSLLQFLPNSSEAFGYPWNSQKQKLIPSLKEDWWLIGPPPDAQEEGIPVKKNKEGKIEAIECVDHHVFQDLEGNWHLWGCVRKTGWGRILYHWNSSGFNNSPWKKTGEFIRANQAFGESINGWDNQEWIQSPFVVKENEKYYMFYGGHSTGRNAQGVPIKGKSRTQNWGTECQICLMTSTNGLDWKRHVFEDGLARLFTGPGEARDPCVIKINGTWHLYYTGLEEGDPSKGGMFLRTSDDLIHWSDYELVHRAASFGKEWYEIECPHVVEIQGYFYLFRTQSYEGALTHVFRSDDPRDFGKNDDTAQEKFVCTLPCAAPEIYHHDDNWYISSNHEPKKGTQISSLMWNPTV